MTVLAAQAWKTNADMMADVAKLYIKPDDYVYDPTYGKGGFWKRFRPEFLYSDDLNPEKGDGGDFRTIQNRMKPETFDVVVFDPAYVTPGGRDTSTIQVMNAAYGMDTTKMSLEEQWDDIVLGMKGCVYALREGGFMMQKCMNYISSGKYHNYQKKVTDKMEELGLTIVDQFVFVRASGGPQPKDRTRICPTCKGNGWASDWLAEHKTSGALCGNCGGNGRVKTVQAHASNNYSVLIVGQK